MFTNNSEQQDIREVYGITDPQKERIISFLQGAVYCWCLNRGTEWFSLRDFMGGTNYFWNGTPLIELYNKHNALGKTDDECVEAAGKDAGWILKMVINNDNRTFETKKEELIRKYRWNGNTENDNSDI